MMTLAKGSHVPPAAVRSAARRGLELRKKHGKGGLTTQEAGKQGIGSGVARASNLAAGDAVSTETLRRMVAFFSRHRKNKSGGEDDAGYIAWLLWGGDPGEAWAKRELAKLDRVEKGGTLLQPMLDLVEVQQPGWLELPRSYALSLGDGLAKGLSHRYIRRVPTGKVTKTGKPRYRYYYHAAHGGTVGNEDHYVVGASFKDDDGHWHITGRDGDNLTLKHDETGEERAMTKRELREHLVGLHREAIAGAQERARQDIADAKASGASKKQVARLQERAARVGVSAQQDHGEKPRKFDELMRRTDALNAKLDAMTPVPSVPKLTTAATNFADDIPMSLAVSAHSGTSHVPERRGEQEREGYAAHLAHVRGQLAKYETPENREAVEQAFAEYRAGYASRYKAMLSAKSRVMSSMVTGPARFPTASNQKRGDIADSRTNDVVEWSGEQSKKLLKRFNPNVSGPISADRKDAVPAIESEVDKLKARQSMMVAANKVYRNKNLSDDEKVAKLVELGVSPTVARAQLKPDFAGRIGFPDYALVNNSANIRRLESRAKSVATEQATATTEHAFDGGRVVDDADSNRVRIYHDSKPPADVIAKLKSSGFKWSPSEGAWQRQRNNAARYAAGVITGANIGKGILSPLLAILGDA